MSRFWLSFRDFLTLTVKSPSLRKSVFRTVGNNGGWKESSFPGGTLQLTVNRGNGFKPRKTYFFAAALATSALVLKDKTKWASSNSKSNSSFGDGKDAYISKSTWEIVRAWTVLKLCSIDFLVNNNEKLMEILPKLVGTQVFEKLMEVTFYGQFVAGPDTEAIQPRIENMMRNGVNAILDYSVEADIEDNQQGECKGTSLIAEVNAAENPTMDVEIVYEKNMENILNSIATVAATTKGNGLAAVKLTALGNPELLLKLSDILKNTESCSLPWKDILEGRLSFREAFEAARPKLRGDYPSLTVKEEEMLKTMVQRMHTVFQTAKEKGVSVMVDAEQSYFQTAISRLAIEMACIYNTEKPIVFNTYQCYLKSAYNDLTKDLDQVKRENVFFGAKLVRGAYMEQERKRAVDMNYEDPINPDFEATNDMYHNCAVEVMQRMKQSLGKIRVMMATHNEDTVSFVIEKMKELGINKSDKLISFGQLYGMCDQISFPLGHMGYGVYKYVPYGPVNKVLPYLSRRAKENRGFLSKVQKETDLLRQEFLRRVKDGVIFNRDSLESRNIHVNCDMQLSH